MPEELEALDSALVTEAIKDVLPESNGIQWDDIAGAAAAAAAAAAGGRHLPSDPAIMCAACMRAWVNAWASMELSSPLGLSEKGQLLAACMRVCAFQSGAWLSMRPQWQGPRQLHLAMG